MNPGAVPPLVSIDAVGRAPAPAKQRIDRTVSPSWVLSIEDLLSELSGTSRARSGGPMGSASFELISSGRRRESLSDWFARSQVPERSRVDVAVSSGSFGVYARVVDNVAGDSAE